MGAGNAFNGSTVAEMYDPSKPVGQRWSAVADSKIWRLYHSVAFLTRNAEVGCKTPASSLWCCAHVEALQSSHYIVIADADA